MKRELAFLFPFLAPFFRIRLGNTNGHHLEIVPPSLHHVPTTHGLARLVPVVGGRGGGGSSYSLPGSLTRPSPHPPLSLSFSPSSSKRVSVSCEGVTHPQKTLRDGVLNGCKPRMNSNYHPGSEIILPRNSMRNRILCLLFLTIICVFKAKLNFDIFPRMKSIVQMIFLTYRDLFKNFLLQTFSNEEKRGKEKRKKASYPLVKNVCRNRHR